MRLLVCGAVLLLISTAGCSALRVGEGRTPPAPQKKAKLFRTQSGDEVTLQWDSVVGTRYSVVYTPDLNRASKWRILPGFEVVEGTGRPIIIEFRAPAPDRLYYRLITRDSPTSVDR